MTISWEVTRTRSECLETKPHKPRRRQSAPDDDNMGIRQSKPRRKVKPSDTLELKPLDSDSSPYGTVATSAALDPISTRASLNRHDSGSVSRFNVQRRASGRNHHRDRLETHPSTTRPVRRDTGGVAAEVVAAAGLRAISTGDNTWSPPPSFPITRREGNADGQYQAEVGGSAYPPRAAVPISASTSHPLADEVSSLSADTFRQYFLNPGASRSSFVSQRDMQILDQMDYTGRMTDIKTAASGGFCDVKSGKLQNDFRTPVAIKVLRSVNMGLRGDPSKEEPELRLIKRLAREMRIWVGLRHPRVLRLLGFAFLDGAPCLISPWCRNGNVKEYLRKNPQANRRALVYQVAEGLNYLHTHNPVVVHADMKSLNILIDDNTEAVICDFGVSIRLGEGRTGLTTANASNHTVRSSAPEIFQDEKHSTASDVYSFGCVALEIMTDKIPFVEVRNTQAVVAAIIRGATQSTSSYPELPEDDPLWALLRWCWHADPKLRPTMRKVLTELAGLRYGLI